MVKKEDEFTKYYRAVYRLPDGKTREEVFIASDENDARSYAEKNSHGRILVDVIKYQCFEDALLS